MSATEVLFFEIRTHFKGEPVFAQPCKLLNNSYRLQNALFFLFFVCLFFSSKLQSLKKSLVPLSVQPPHVFFFIQFACA